MTSRAALKFLYPGWYATVMGLAGLGLAWHRAVPLMGAGASAAALALDALAALVFVLLLGASALRWQRHREAWVEDLRHPVRHAFVAALPVSLLLLVTAAVAAGLDGAGVRALWWLGALLQLLVTVWVLARWWKPAAVGAAAWAVVTPALFIPIVGNVLVPLAGVPLGYEKWAAAQFGAGVLFWPVLLALLMVRVWVQGPWPERLLPANFILVAPPALIGLSLLRLGAPPLLVWALWGMALLALLWVLPLLPRIAALPFGLAHWGMGFPLAAFTALTLALNPTGPLAMLGVLLLAATSLLVAAFTLASLRGLRDGRLLSAETVPIVS